MDQPNNTTVQTPVKPEQAQPVQPKEQPSPLPPTTKSSNSPVMVTITVMVIISLGVAGFFFVKNNNGQPETTATTQIQSGPTSTAASPTIDPTDETQIEAIDLGDTDTSDLTSVEKEISSL